MKLTQLQLSQIPAGWSIEWNPKPIPSYCGVDWDYCHQDYGGPPDCRYGCAASFEACLSEIAEIEGENDPGQDDLLPTFAEVKARFPQAQVLSKGYSWLSFADPADIVSALIFATPVLKNVVPFRREETL